MLKTLAPVLLALAAGAAPAAAAVHLQGEPSAFIKQFADSPVDWMPWGEAAFARAKAEQKPVFLFVGSFSSELAGAMRRQTFSNAKNAEWLNAHYVCVLVDREERPDVAALYEAYLFTMKQVTGWPLNVWLTPEFQPFEGATYLSPSEDWGAPGFLKLAAQAESAWVTSPAACRRRAAEAAAQMAPPKESTHAAWSPEKNKARLEASSAAWLAAFDSEHSGFGDAPRVPEPELVRFMMLSPGPGREAALSSLRALAASAVRDPLDGGFFRHAADASWRIPYQQKTLADQARIALAYLDVPTGPDERSFGQCARGALNFALNFLTERDGGFDSVQDATGDAYANYYSWSAAEIDAVLGAQSEFFKKAHGVLPDGNIPADDDPSGTYTHRNLLRSSALDDSRLLNLRASLFGVRIKRGSPPVDPRSTAGDSGLMLCALARAGEHLGDARFRSVAKLTYEGSRRRFLVSPDGTLRHIALTSLVGTSADYAGLALGFREYARMAHDAEAGALADRVLAQLDARYFDAASGSLFGAPNPPGQGFFVRPLPADDPPSADSLAIIVGAPHARELAASLSQSLDESSAQAPGDELLALALYAGR